MIRKIFSFIAALAVMIGLGGFITNSASAAEDPVSMKSEVFFKETADSAVHVISSTAITTDSKGRLLVGWVNDPAAPKLSVGKARKAPFVKNYQAGVKTCKVFRLKRGKTYPTTYNSSSGRVNIPNHAITTPWTSFAPNAGCKYFHMGYPKASKWVNRCKNPEPTRRMPKYRYSQIHVKRKLVLTWVVTGYGVVGIEARALAHVELGGCIAESWVTGLGSAKFEFDERITFRSSTRIDAEGQAVRYWQQNRTKASADAKASAEVAMEGNAYAMCQQNPTPTPTPVHQNPLAEYFLGEHAVDPGGTMPVFGRAKAFDGATVTLGSPVVSPSSLGGVYNWRSVSTERDGVTPCETGWTCYQGYFRAQAEGNGTLTGTASDSMGGMFNPQPLSFVSVFIIHPDT